MMSTGTSWESVKMREKGPVIFKGVLADGNENTANPTKNSISVSYNTYGSSIYTGYDEDWLEKGVNYLRLQELRLAYIVPAKWLKGTHIDYANIYIVGNDLATCNHLHSGQTDVLVVPALCPVH